MNTLIKIITLIIFQTAVTTISSQSAYEKGMQKAFDLWETNQIEESINLFERIANAEKNEWLPHYYVAYLNSSISWNEKDEAVLKAHLDKAQAHLDKAIAVSDNNAELKVMQAYLYTNWVAFDGMKYGMSLGPKISQLYQEALAIDGNNPRVIFGKAEWDMGSAKFFGKDMTPYCKDIEKSIELFANFKPETKFSPNWGAERAEQVLQSCKS
ncbi:hypothetical protein Q2T40_12990 [Winogradskyella maritima]|uniref:Tetratricopeptide repeat protein n=1 Tax=Winogradskyella maritima TaxID=1517766 RepID=A0ABV8AIV2_9FLAO|nr:hypothetical protein [Winogradskyella maritima]